LEKCLALLNAVSYAQNSELKLTKYKRKAAAKKELTGVDVFYTGAV
jgi:hypothetical protein